MPANCGICEQVCCDDNTTVKCVGKCERVFHLKCIKDDVEGKKTRSYRDWRCKSCRESSSVQSSVGSTSATITKEFFLSVLDEFKREVFCEINSLRKEMTDVTNSMAFLSSRLDDTNTLMNEIKSELAAIKKENAELRSQNTIFDKSVGELQERVRSLEQYTRRNNIEISGIPVTPQENVMAIIKDMSEVLGIGMQEPDVVAAHRIPSYKQSRVPSIVVQFDKKEVRDSWIKGYKEKRGITAKQVNPNFQNNKVYVNEHLSPENKLFLSRLKRKCQEINYAFAWTRDGKFYVRKAEREPYIRIGSCRDIESLK